MGFLEWLYRAYGDNYVLLQGFGLRVEWGLGLEV